MIFIYKGKDTPNGQYPLQNNNLAIFYNLMET